MMWRRWRTHRCRSRALLQALGIRPRMVICVSRWEPWKPHNEHLKSITGSTELLDDASGGHRVVRLPGDAVVM